MTETTNSLDRKSYWLWNPVPSAAMRDMAMDAPDQTESPHSVPAGHFQAESFLGNLNFSGARKFSEFAFASTLYKVGVSDNVDLQLGIDPYVKTADDHGFGDIALRVKWAVIGNDSGPFALGAMPFVQFPTVKEDAVGSDHVEGGIVFPWSLELTDSWGVGGQLQLDLIHNGAGYQLGLLGSAEVTLAISDDWGTYLETLVKGQRGSPVEVMLDGGLTFAATDGLIVFAGINKGVSGTLDWNPFAGFGWRY